jgi:hypothetical protein
VSNPGYSRDAPPPKLNTATEYGFLMTDNMEEPEIKDGKVVNQDLNSTEGANKTASNATDNSTITNDTGPVTFKVKKLVNPAMKKSTYMPPYEAENND